MHRRPLPAAFTALLLAAALSASPAGARAAESPRDIVTEIYQISAGKDGSYRSASAFSDKAVRRRYFSRSLLAAVDRMEQRSARKNEPILDFDPITNSQDPDVKNLEIAVESETPAKVTVAAHFLSFEEKEPSIVRYHFIREGGAWKLDEIRGEHAKDKWSLRFVIK